MKSFWVLRFVADIELMCFCELKIRIIRILSSRENILETILESQKTVFETRQYKWADCENQDREEHIGICRMVRPKGAWNEPKIVDAGFGWGDRRHSNQEIHQDETHWRDSPSLATFCSFSADWVIIDLLYSSKRSMIDVCHLICFLFSLNKTSFLLNFPVELPSFCNFALASAHTV